MNSTLLACIVSTVLIAEAVGGEMTFNPPTLTIDRSAGPTVQTVEVSVWSPSDLPMFGFDIALQSDGVPITGWDYIGPPEPRFCDPFPCHHQFLPSLLLLDSVDLYGVPLPLTFARMSLDAAGVANGDYQVLVDSDQSGLYFMTFGSEPLSGALTISVVPEPSSIAVLCGGVLFAATRRRWHLSRNTLSPED